MVEAEHAQSDRARWEAPPSDHWKPYAENFRADPLRTDDELLDRLLKDVKAEDRVMDVGAGGGRLALALALRCRQVIAVEPSESMGSVLLDEARAHGIGNVSLVRSRWEDADVEPVDVVLCCHVLYVVGDIDAFVRKLDVHARREVLVVLYDRSPQFQNSPLWELVHGEERLQLPAVPELREVLLEMGMDARFDPLPPHPSRGFDTVEEAVEQLTSRLYLAPGSEKQKMLERDLPGLLVGEDGVFRIRGAPELTPVVVSWQPRW
jgi:SAM-dependent methyltransferase